jgi:SAM-dependent methyltransferase
MRATSPPLPRKNQLESYAESWRPPLFRPVVSRWDRIMSAARRLLDLQAASIWRDLAVLLPQCRGLVLDVGCGAQPFRPLLGPGATYRGIDHARTAIHLGYSVPDTSYYEGDRWPIADDSVDAVLCTETLEHVPEPPAFLAEAGRCLKPGGRLLLTVPFAARWHYIPHDYWRFTPSGLERLLSDAGFERIAVFARGNAVTVACYKAMALMLPLLLPQRKKSLVRIALRAAGLLTSPILVLLAGIAAISLRGQGGDDCLGYTVVAEKAHRPRSLSPACDPDGYAVGGVTRPAIAIRNLDIPTDASNPDESIQRLERC